MPLMQDRGPRTVPSPLSRQHGLFLSTNLPRKIVALMALVSHRRYPSRAEGLNSQVQVHSSQKQRCARGQDQQAKVDHGGSREVRRYIDQ